VTAGALVHCTTCLTVCYAAGLEPVTLRVSVFSNKSATMSNSDVSLTEVDLLMLSDVDLLRLISANA